MKVLYDYQAFIQRIGGISRYHTELIKNFSNDIEAKLPFLLSDNCYLKETRCKILSIFASCKSANKYQFYKAFDLLSSIASLKYSDFDIFHPTFVNPYFIGKTNKPVVITIHDLNPDKFPDLLPKTDIVKKKEKLCCEAADHIIAISEETKSDLMKYHNVSEEKITVIYHGVDQTQVHVTGKPLFEFPYLLYIGNRKGYKNFNAFLNAFSLLKEDIHLVCTGVPFNDIEMSVITKKKIKKRVHQMFVSDDQLNNLLCYAEAFVYPSLGEGFGLPILEAYRCGCPCVVSDLHCFNEVAGDAALYFNPTDVDSILSAMQKIIGNDSLKKELRTLGYNRMKLFKWSETAKQTEILYNNLVCR